MKQLMHMRTPPQQGGLLQMLRVGGSSHHGSSFPGAINNSNGLAQSGFSSSNSSVASESALVFGERLWRRSHGRPIQRNSRSPCPKHYCISTALGESIMFHLMLKRRVLLQCMHGIM